MAPPLPGSIPGYAQQPPLPRPAYSTAGFPTGAYPPAAGGHPAERSLSRGSAEAHTPLAMSNVSSANDLATLGLQQFYGAQAMMGYAKSSEALPRMPPPPGVVDASGASPNMTGGGYPSGPLSSASDEELRALELGHRPQPRLVPLVGLRLALLRPVARAAGAAGGEGGAGAACGRLGPSPRRARARPRHAPHRRQL